MISRIMRLATDPRPPTPDPYPSCLRRFLQRQQGQEGFLRYLHVAYHLHTGFAFFLLLQELALAGNIASVALGEHVLAHRGYGLAGDDLPADRGLYGHLEELA